MISSKVRLSFFSNCAELSSGFSFSAYPPTLVEEAPLIWDTPTFNTRSLDSCVSRVDTMIPV